MKTVLSILVLSFLLVARPIQAQDSKQYLAAGCAVASRNNAQVVDSQFGPGVQHRGGKLSDVVLHCTLNPPISSNEYCFLQLVAEDNTPDGYATATLWRMNTSSATPAEQLYQVKTSDQPGVQVAFFNQFATTLDPEHYVYWIEIRIVRTSPDAVVTAYSTALKNVF